jgi:dienelactone hydrolase
LRSSTAFAVFSIAKAASVREFSGMAQPSGLSPATTVGDHPTLPDRELRLREMFAEVTGVATVDPDSNFFSLGGRGLKAMRLAAMIRAEYGVDLPTHLLLTHLTPRALAPLIDMLPRAIYVRHGEFDIRMIRRASKATVSEGAVLCMPQLGGGDDYANIIAASCLRNFDLWSCRFHLNGDEQPYDKNWVACARELAEWLHHHADFVPVALLGFSAGGYTAWLVDRLLVAAGRKATRQINLDGGPIPNYDPDLRARISAMLPAGRTAPARMLLLHRERFGKMPNPARFDHGWEELNVYAYPVDNRTVCHLDVLSNEFLSAHNELITRFILGRPWEEIQAACPPAISTPGGRLYRLLDQGTPPASDELRALIDSLPSGRVDDDLVLPLLWLTMASGDGDLALTIARRFVAERPDDRNAHYALIAALFELGRRGEAADVAGEWCVRKPDDPVMRARARARVHRHADMSHAAGLFGRGSATEKALDVAASLLR